MSVTNKLGFVIRQAPYGNHFAHEALEAVLAAGIYGQEVSLFFLDDGVFQLLDTQNTDSGPHKNLARQMTALDLYGVEAIYVSQSTLDARGLICDVLVAGTIVLSNQKLSEYLHQQQVLINF